MSEPTCDRCGGPMKYDLAPCADCGPDHRQWLCVADCQAVAALRSTEEMYKRQEAALRECLRMASEGLQRIAKALDCPATVPAILGTIDAIRDNETEATIVAAGLRQRLQAEIATQWVEIARLNEHLRYLTGAEAESWLHGTTYSFLRRPKGPDEERVSPEEAEACAAQVARLWSARAAEVTQAAPPPPTVDREGLGRLAWEAHYAGEDPYHNPAGVKWEQVMPHAQEAWRRSAEAVARAAGSPSLTEEQRRGVEEIRARHTHPIASEPTTYPGRPWPGLSGLYTVGADAFADRGDLLAIIDSLAPMEKAHGK